ncbi:hypothetical protein GA0061096_1070 [Fictibacillus enclensis]|uniref:Uncharacterized protein n=1 Tax=Fictibacillus enclensis TaxID=1017270 RepID=A0A0V8JD15_9BACL|nr:hypothetical protein AS030_05080 [Fictibacillus enclensis]SCB87595.1 hypothetical protein GA0061096_1070 [Fictibacillus enclensis]
MYYHDLRYLLQARRMYSNFLTATSLSIVRGQEPNISELLEPGNTKNNPSKFLYDMHTKKMKKVAYGTEKGSRLAITYGTVAICDCVVRSD